MQSVERSDRGVFPYGPSLTGGDQSPAVLGGASMPPPSPSRLANFAVGAVGIPTSQPPRKIKNVDENKWEEGYDSDGELGPFLDAVANQGTVDVEGEDNELPDSMMGVGSGVDNTTNTAGEVTSPDWICPQLYGAKKQKRSIASQRGDQRSAASSSRGSSKRCVETVASATRAAKKSKVEVSSYASTKRVDDDTSAFNRCRLDESVPHYPEPVENESRGKCCALCRYATGKKTIACIMNCRKCNVILCLWCFRPFHTLPSISAAKNNICAEINARNDAKKAKKGKHTFKVMKSVK
jgi:hypothetical protein